MCMCICKTEIEAKLKPSPNATRVAPKNAPTPELCECIQPNKTEKMKSQRHENDRICWKDKREKRGQNHDRENSEAEDAL